tara:strand:+ start:669 stop:830 length:162 start_codon:yes stop_codon:yes gene_type:complete
MFKNKNGNGIFKSKNENSNIFLRCTEETIISQGDGFWQKIQVSSHKYKNLTEK